MELRYSGWTAPVMFLEFQKRSVEPDLVVFELGGKIVLGQESESIQKLVQEALRRGEKKLIFDLSRVEYIDSTGLGVIVHCVSAVKSAGGAIRLAAPSEPVRHEFKTSKLDTIFPLYPTVEAACEDLG